MAMLKSIFMGLALAAMPIAITAMTVQPAYAGGDEIYTSWRNDLSAGGFDVVSFHMGSPLKGDPKLSIEWKNAQWQFATKANLETFMAAPETYAPAYGGYCAWALAENKLAKGSPKYWTVKDGILYLNFNQKIQDRWLKDIDGFITKADANWPKILQD